MTKLASLLIIAANVLTGAAPVPVPQTLGFNRCVQVLKIRGMPQERMQKKQSHSKL
jgi:hypothetical protein